MRLLDSHCSIGLVVVDLSGIVHSHHLLCALSMSVGICHLFLYSPISQFSARTF